MKTRKRKLNLDTGFRRVKLREGIETGSPQEDKQEYGVKEITSNKVQMEGTKNNLRNAKVKLVMSVRTVLGES